MDCVLDELAIQLSLSPCVINRRYIGLPAFPDLDCGSQIKYLFCYFSSYILCYFVGFLQPQ